MRAFDKLCAILSSGPDFKCYHYYYSDFSSLRAVMDKMKFGKTVRLIAMLGLTGGFFVVELVVGYMTNSMALVADSFHMLSDLIALIIGLLSVRIARKKSEKNTFGWARAEVLGALVNAVFLCALCFSIFIESIERFISGVEITNPVLVLIVGAVGLVINIVGLFLFHDHSHGHEHSHNHAQEDQDMESGNHGQHSHGSASQMNMKGVFLHVAGDAFGSVVVIIAAVVIWKTDWKYRSYIDPAMSMISVVVILGMTLPLLYSSALILLQTVPLNIKARDVKTRLEKMAGVVAVHELHIWQLAGSRIVASAHIWFKDYQDYKVSAKAIKEFFHNEGIHSTTVQPEFEDFDGSGMCITPSESGSMCGMVCPKEKRCDDSMCCKPPRSASRRHSRATSVSPLSLKNRLQLQFIGLSELPKHNIPSTTTATKLSSQNGRINPAFNSDKEEPSNGLPVSTIPAVNYGNHEPSEMDNENAEQVVHSSSVCSSTSDQVLDERL